MCGLSLGNVWKTSALFDLFFVFNVFNGAARFYSRLAARYALVINMCVRVSSHPRFRRAKRSGIAVCVINLTTQCPLE